MTVTPNETLLDTQTLNVSLSGFPTDTEVYIGQCRVPLTSRVHDCGGGYVQATTADGTLDGGLDVHRSFTADSGQLIDCGAAGSCGVGVLVESNVSDAELVPITFRPGHVVVTPTRDLFDGQELSVVVTGFPPQARIRIEQCAHDAELFERDCGAESYEATTDLSGSFQGTLAVRQAFTTASYQVLCLGPWECQAGASLVDDPTEHHLVRIRFQESPPTLRLSPTTGLHNMEPVHFEVSGFPAGALLDYSECRTSSEQCQWLGTTYSDASGAFAGELMARSVISLIDDTAGAHLYQCAGPEACSILFSMPSANGELWQASAPLTFSAISAPRGEARIDLTSDLIADMTVRLEGSGWAPNRSLRATQCKGAGFEVCAPPFSDILDIQTDSSGTFRTYQLLLGAPFEGRPDCRPPANGCFLVIADDNDLAGSALRISLNFVERVEVAVTSAYEPKWQSLLRAGARASGSSFSELQRSGATVLTWLMLASGESTSTHFPREGLFRFTTTYSADEYRQWTGRAAQFDYTLDELQKTGALFYSWLLAGRPALPQ
ncbi:MAG TPA: neocarzinostatin apoprotein domain-containing protein [Polyangiaceae bacterium]